MIEAVIEQVRVSRKYRDLCDETLTRIAQWAWERHPSVKSATKVAKRKLHQVYGAYAGQVDVKEVQRLIDLLDLDDLKTGCKTILSHHKSTAERLEILDSLFDALWQITGRPTSIMDPACGFNPFVWPWMQLSDVTYYACDIDRALVGCVEQFWAKAGVDGKIECRDLLVSVPGINADVAFLLKTLPCLEQQEKGAGLRILEAIQAPFVVVSFPTLSLGGKDRGMGWHYEAIITRLVKVHAWRIHRLPFEGETFYVLEK